MTSSFFPHLNAMLNATSGVLLVLGYLCIRTQHVAAHRFCMVGAFGVTVLFFISYITYHVHVGSVHFRGTGWVRPLYFTILLTHTILAVVVAPLAVRTLWLASQERFMQHKALARWTLPIWLYVSVTGVIVYWMLYHLKA